MTGEALRAGASAALADQRAYLAATAATVAAAAAPIVAAGAAHAARAIGTMALRAIVVEALVRAGFVLILVASLLHLSGRGLPVPAVLALDAAGAWSLAALHRGWFRREMPNNGRGR